MMVMSNSAASGTTHGRLYRVGKHWYVDTALLQTIARRITVEPMQGGYQILAPAGLVRCVPADGLALPGQTGELYRCKGQSADQDVGARLRKLAGAQDADVIGGEWEQSRSHNTWRTIWIRGTLPRREEGGGKRDLPGRDPKIQANPFPGDQAGPSREPRRLS